jgi:hypothetical protein
MVFPKVLPPDAAGPLKRLWDKIRRRRNQRTSSEALRKDARAQRDFIVEMLDRHPGSFQSEMDVQHLARLYRGKC